MKDMRYSILPDSPFDAHIRFILREVRDRHCVSAAVDSKPKLYACSNSPVHNETSVSAPLPRRGENYSTSM